MRLVVLTTLDEYATASLGPRKSFHGSRSTNKAMYLQERCVKEFGANVIRNLLLIYVFMYLCVFACICVYVYVYVHVYVYAYA